MPSKSFLTGISLVCRAYLTIPRRICAYSIYACPISAYSIHSTMIFVGIFAMVANAIIVFIDIIRRTIGVALTSVPAVVTQTIIVGIVTFLASILIWAAAVVTYAIVIGVAELLANTLIRLR